MKSRVESAKQSVESAYALESSNLLETSLQLETSKAADALEIARKGIV